MKKKKSSGECLQMELDFRSRVYVCRQQQERVEGSTNPTLVAELRALRSHRHELESNLSYLQDSRKQLMQQLESLMKMLKVCISIKLVLFFILDKFNFT